MQTVGTIYHKPKLGGWRDGKLGVASRLFVLPQFYSGAFLVRVYDTGLASRAEIVSILQVMLKFHASTQVSYANLVMHATHACYVKMAYHSERCHKYLCCLYFGDNL